MPAVAINKSNAALHAFATSIKEQNGEMRSLLSAMMDDFIVAGGNIHTGWDDAMNGGRMLTWQQFCVAHDLNGVVFLYAVEALMDLEIAMSGDKQLTLRDLADENVLLMIDWLVGGPEESTLDIALRLWVQCAMFLGRHLEHRVPPCMQP